MAEKAKSTKAKKVSKKKTSKAAKKSSTASTTTKKSKSKTSAKKTAKKKAAKKATKKKVVETKAELDPQLENPPLEEIFDAETPVVPEEAAVEPATAKEGALNITLSQTLLKKLKSQAEEEGITLEDFVSELLSESVVLRAWEIVERKTQMRSMPSQNVGNRSGNVGNSNAGRNNRSKGRGGMSHGRYQSIMDDKATFLEYVRNQERSRR